jgi:hypothetical protein
MTLLLQIVNSGWLMLGVLLMTMLITIGVVHGISAGQHKQDQLPPPQPDPIAWLFAPDADPAAVARLQKELARPLAELVREAERKVIAESSPLEGDPAKAEVKDCTVSDRRLFAPPEEVVSLIGGGSTYIEVTALGDRERSYIEVPGGTNWTHYSGHVTHHYGGGGGGSCTLNLPSVTTPPRPVRPEPAVLRDLRDRRLFTWEAAKRLADAAGDEGRSFTDDEAGQWDMLMNQLDVLDGRIKGCLSVLAEHDRRWGRD